MNHELMELLKEMSKIVCLEMCNKVTEIEECRKCEFMVTLNKLMNRVL